MTQNLQTVHVRVNDTATGQPAPCRIRFTDAEGNHYAPFGRLTEFPTGRNQEVGGNLLLGMKAHAYIDGACEIALPPGPIRVHIHKGPEFTPQQVELTLAPGKMALRFGLDRWINMRQEGWHPGDARAHFLSPHAALLEAAAEDLAVVNLLITESQVRDGHKTHRTMPNILAFSGQQPALQMPGHLVVVNTLNTHPELGSLALLNCHRLVFPLTFGGPEGLDDWSLAAWCDQCHRKNGLVAWARTAHDAADFELGEPLADLILGKVDAFEIDFFEDSPFDVLPRWYQLLNAGLRVPLVGSSGKDSNAIALGAMRTYARLQSGEEFSYRNWIEAVRKGRTFVTNGPLLSFQVNGQDPGATIDVPAAGEVHVRADCHSQVPLERLELVVSGSVVSSAVASGTPACAALDLDVPMSATSWLAVRCRGDRRPADQRVFAHTSPVYVRVARKPFARAPMVVQNLTVPLDRMLEWARHQARCETNQQREHLAGIFTRARERLLDVVDPDPAH